MLAHETGNAIRTQARPEIQMTVNVMRYFAGLGGELKGITAPLRQGVLDYSRREPLGVVGGIIPWNSPALLAVLKLAPALIAGNTFVLKPAEDAPLTVLEIVRELAELLPSGVLNAVTGLGEEAGAALAAHPGVAKVSFTGSTEVGKSIMHAVSGRIGSVSLELGGKNPQIVFPDADDDWVLDGVILAMRFTRQGQSCTAGSRLFLHESIFDSFLDRLVDRLRLLKVGDPLDEASDMGAIINAKQFNRVCSYIDDGATTPGSKTVLGGLPPSSGPLSEGYFVEPTVIANVENNWRIAQEEIFGPVLCAIPWSENRGGDRDGKRLSLRSLGLRLDARPWQRRTNGTRHRLRMGPGQSGRGTDPRAVLRWIQGERPRQGVLARGDARGLHPDQANRDQHRALSLYRARRSHYRQDPPPTTSMQCKAAASCSSLLGMPQVHGRLARKKVISASVAQWIRASDFGSEGREFESLRGHR